MRKTQNEIIKKLNVELPRENENITDFATRMISERTEFLKSYLEKVKMEGFVLGLSGGVDSFVASMLAKRTGYPLLSVSLPYKEQSDMDDVVAAQKVIKPDFLVFYNIFEEVDSVINNIMLKNMQYDLPIKENYELVKGNIMARQRMVVQYAYAQFMNYLVLGTDHATETVVGFYTKFGDGAADILPLAGLTKDVIYKMAELLNAPQTILDKAPAAGLGISENDEEELGLKYDDIIAFLKGESIKVEDTKKIINKYNVTEHKRQLPVTINDDWWKNKKKSLVVVDAQYDFIDGTLGCLEDDTVIYNIVDFINQNENNLSVVYSRDFHPIDHSSFEINGGQWPVHCVRYELGSELHSAFDNDIHYNHRPVIHHNVFLKGENPEVEEYSAYNAKLLMYNTEKYLYLNELLEEDVIVCGIAGEFCIKETVIDLYNNGYNVYLLKDGLGFVFKDKIEETLKELSKYCTII